jgi:murein L,D-transpeptidase YafK
VNHFSAIVPQYLRLQRQLLTGVLLLLSVVAPLHADNIHILVDTDSRVLQVLRGTRVVASFEGVAIGRYGKSYFRRKGDNRTPLGKFRIGWITSNTRYHLFLGLTFPDLEAADRALQDGGIDEAQWQAIRRASVAGKTPPQNTPLGGNIGIHGVGKGDVEVHEQYNWTNGCVALTNAQIDQLVRWVKVGTPVEIR